MLRAAAIVCCLGLAAGVLAEESAAIRPAPEGSIVVTEANNAKEISASVGRTVEVRLEGERPRTGWEDGAASGGVLEFLGMEQKPKEGAADKAIGTYTFRYKAAKEGTAALRMVYVTPGGPEVKERDATGRVREFKVTVRVKPAIAVLEARAALSDNATAKFVGPEGQWPQCKLVLRDVQPLFGGRDMYLDGSGDCLVRLVKGNEKRFRLKLTGEDWAALRPLCILGDLVDLKIKERPGVPDEARPEIALSNAAGETRKVAKWANDKVPAFDKVYAALLGIARRTADAKPEYEGKFDPGWRPEGK